MTPHDGGDDREAERLAKRNAEREAQARYFELWRLIERAETLDELLAAATWVKADVARLSKYQVVTLRWLYAGRALRLQRIGADPPPDRRRYEARVERLSPAEFARFEHERFLDRFEAPERENALETSCKRNTPERRAA